MFQWNTALNSQLNGWTDVRKILMGEIAGGSQTVIYNTSFHSRLTNFKVCYYYSFIPVRPFFDRCLLVQRITICPREILMWCKNFKEVLKGYVRDNRLKKKKKFLFNIIFYIVGLLILESTTSKKTKVKALAVF